MDCERIGSSFESFIKDEGIRDEVEKIALDRVSAWLDEVADADWNSAAIRSAENTFRSILLDAGPLHPPQSGKSPRVRHSVHA